MDIYVGNLSYDATEKDIENLFAKYGKVDNVNLISDRDTGRAKGFGFVSMGNDDEGNAAINELDGKDLLGRAIKVNQARPKEDRQDKPRRSGGGGGGYGGGGGGGGGYGGGGRGRR